MKILWLTLIPSLVFTSTVFGAVKQNHDKISNIALAYAQSQTQNLPGKIHIKIENIDPRISLPACGTLEAFLPAGSKLIGKTTIGVRCNENPGWTIFVQTSIKVSVDMLVTNRPLAQNTVLSANDFSIQNGELGQAGVLINPVQVVGRILKFSVGAGQALRQDLLRAPYVVTQGQTTEVRVQSTGLSIRSTGMPLNNGVEGQNVQVRMVSGMVVSGVATADGNVDVRP